MSVETSIAGVIVTKLSRREDTRGWLVELFREDEIGSGKMPKMCYVSLTRPGNSRGPHEHRSQTDRFAFVGPSIFRIYLWDNRVASPTYRAHQIIEVGDNRPISLEVPPGVVHGYKNIGPVDGLVHNFPDQLYAGKGRTELVDEIRHEDDPHSLFVMKD